MHADCDKAESVRFQLRTREASVNETKPDTMKTFHFVECFLFFSTVLGHRIENSIQTLDYDPDIEPYEKTLTTEEPIFNYRKNGIRLDVKVVPAVNDTVVEDHFPDFPMKDFGGCVIDLSLICIQKKFLLFLDKIEQLKDITLFGTGVKLVRNERPKQEAEKRQMKEMRRGIGDMINRRIDTFFDDYALRITLPSIRGKEEENRIDIMFDEHGLGEGRGKGGGGGKGGKCKKMMMMMLMMVKMKMMGMVGVMAMKGMMMAGMSLMMSKWMLIQKLMDLKKGGGGGGGGGGPWQGGGGGGGGGQLKEIVLLTKSAGGGGSPPPDSYGAPPANSYGPPSGGGGGYDSGGSSGWGRSFNENLSISRKTVATDIQAVNKTTPENGGKISESSNVTESTDPNYKSDGTNAKMNSSLNIDKMLPKHRQGEDSERSRLMVVNAGFRVGSEYSVEGENPEPVYVKDWENYEPAKQWNQNYSIPMSSWGLKKVSREKFEKKANLPDGRLVGLFTARNVSLHGA